jgi:transposase InsO family protein
VHRRTAHARRGAYAAWCGARKIRATVSDPGYERATDRLARDFTAAAPNRCWVADFTHVATFAGVVYVAFVVDVYSRAIVGWSAATNQRTPLVLDAIDMGLWRRDRDGRAVQPGLIYHSNARVARGIQPVVATRRLWRLRWVGRRGG